MGFGDAVKSFWSNYSKFKGRSRRSEYWWIQLFLVLTNLAVAAIDLVLMNGDVERFIANGGGGIVGLVWILVTIVPALAVLVRRLHDTGKGGWWALIGFVPIVGAIILLVFTVLDSEVTFFSVWTKNPMQTARKYMTVLTPQHWDLAKSDGPTAGTTMRQICE